ncbi:hypothetical protein TNCV_81891 [Trichonephila clavipes]|nr:hypothetical protein TNCV_81891 [Trichonephila clavipes]
MLMGYKRSLEMIRNFFPTSRLCLRDVLPCPLESIMLPMSKNCRILNHEEILALFFKMEKRDYVRNEPLLSCRAPPTFTVDENGIKTFPELQENFKEALPESKENEEVLQQTKTCCFMLHYATDGKPKRTVYYEGNDPENKREFVRC